MKPSDTMLLLLGTLGGTRKLLEAGKHNLREISGSHIDDRLRHMNVPLFGPATSRGVAELCIAKMQALGIDPKTQRKNGTRAAEIIFGLPASTSVDMDAYFRACVQWVSEFFGEQVLLSAVVHHDEGAPHCHVLIVPVKGGSWLASGIFGLKADVKALQADFFRRVASRFGVRRAPERMSVVDRKAAAASVIKHLRATNAPVLGCQTWPVVRDSISANPRPWAEQLGIPIVVRLKTLAELKVSPGRGPKKERTPIDVLVREKSNLYPVLDLSPKPILALPADPAAAGAAFGAQVDSASLADGRVDNGSTAVYPRINGIEVEFIDAEEIQAVACDVSLPDTLTVPMAAVDPAPPLVESKAKEERDRRTHGVRSEVCPDTLSVQADAKQMSARCQAEVEAATSGLHESFEDGGLAFKSVIAVDSIEVSKKVSMESMPPRAAGPLETRIAPTEGGEDVEAAWSAPAPAGGGALGHRATLAPQSTQSLRAIALPTTGAGPRDTEPEVEIIRLREEDWSADHWDEQLGAFMPAVVARSSRCRLSDAAA